MTNEEKAKQIVCPKCLFGQQGDQFACANCPDYNSVLQMAEWKDEQFKILLKAIREELQLEKK